MKEEQEIRLCTVENNEFNDIRILSKKTLIQIKNDIKTINEYSSHFLVFVYFGLNYREFENLRTRLINVPVTKIDINTLLNTNNYLNANRIIFNLLSSFKFYLDNSEKHIKRKFGKKSPESNAFKSLLSSFFEKYFSYRLLSKLRVFAQHMGFPIDMTPFFAEENRINPENMIGEFKLVVSREKLLSEEKLIGKPLREDLNKMNQDIDIIPLVIQLGKIIDKIEEHIYLLHNQPLKESISNLEMFAGEFKTENNEISIVHNVDEHEGIISVKTLIIPFTEIREIESFRNLRNI